MAFRKNYLWMLIVTLLGLFVIVPQQPVHAATTPVRESGLLITPLRQYLSADSGGVVKSSFTIANLTDDTLAVTVSVEQFSVENYTYNYEFTQPSNDWLQLSTEHVSLPSHASRDIPYTIDVPSGTAAGGHYYTLLASATMASQGVASTVQAADMVYMTVTGALTDVSHLEKSHIQRVAFGHDIGFELLPVNTGNIYSFVYVSGQLHGLLVKPPQTSSGHVLMPGKVRTLAGTIPSPVLPGIYRAIYGYKTDGGWTVQKTSWVVFIPPWFIALVLAGVLVAGKFVPAWRRRRKPSDPMG